MILYFILGILIVGGIIALSVYVRWRNSPKQKGLRGEKAVSDMLKSLGGAVIDNFVVLDDSGKSHQIDHIYIAQSGVFIIETKNYVGTIYGNKERREWTQSLSYGRVTNQFYSPIKQNASHVYHVRKILPKGTPVFACVVFPSADISHVDVENVFTMNGLWNYILSRTNVLSVEQVRDVTKGLEQNRNLSVTKEEHVLSIQKTLNDVENGICPRCHARLVLRDGKNGKFYGCSNYPKCKFTKKL